MDKVIPNAMKTYVRERKGREFEVYKNFLRILYYLRYIISVTYRLMQSSNILKEGGFDVTNGTRYFYHI